MDGCGGCWSAPPGLRRGNAALGAATCEFEHEGIREFSEFGWESNNINHIAQAEEGEGIQ